MEYDRAQLKRSVRLAMKRASPSPMLVTLLFTVVVSVGTLLLNTIAGRLLTGGMNRYTALFLGYIGAGYDVEEAAEQMLLALLSQGPGIVLAAGVGSFVLSILISLWQSTMGVGYAGYALSMVRGENPTMGKDLLCHSPNRRRADHPDCDGGVYFPVDPAAVGGIRAGGAGGGRAGCGC